MLPRCILRSNDVYSPLYLENWCQPPLLSIWCRLEKFIASNNLMEYASPWPHLGIARSDNEGKFTDVVHLLDDCSEKLVALFLIVG